MTTPIAVPPVLELEDVDIPVPALPELAMLRNLDWRVEEGERWLVTGATGAGKTSVLQVAAGLIRPLRGRHRLFGGDLAGLGEREQEKLRSRVGVVFGGGGRLFAQLTVAENLALPLFYHGRDRTESGRVRIGELLEALALTAYADRQPRELPRRLSERVALARALVLDPEILLVDDVAAGLPAAEVDWWRGWIGGGTGKGLELVPGLKTVVMAATDPVPWLDLADRMAVVEVGRWRTAAGSEGRDLILRPAPGG